MINSIIASTSTLPDGNYLEYLLPQLKELYNNCNEIVFIPYAQPSGISYEEYTKRTAQAFSKIDVNVHGIHEFENGVTAIKNAKGIYTGGGNTFLLVNQLYKNSIMIPLKEAILNGTPYLGTSAGSNICGLTMQTTNDMPIVYPPSFKTLGILPFNINPHYLDPDRNLKHAGETRETRIKEYHAFNNVPVLGLREGSWIEMKGENITLRGNISARLFQKEKESEEISCDTNLNFIK